MLHHEWFSFIISFFYQSMLTTYFEFSLKFDKDWQLVSNKRTIDDGQQNKVEHPIVRVMKVVVGAAGVVVGLE